MASFWNNFLHVSNKNHLDNLDSENIIISNLIYFWPHFDLRKNWEISWLTPRWPQFDLRKILGPSWVKYWIQVVFIFLPTWRKLFPTILLIDEITQTLMRDYTNTYERLHKQLLLLFGLFYQLLETPFRFIHPLYQSTK